MSPDSGGGWRTRVQSPSLPEANSSIPLSKHPQAWRKFMAFVGPGLLVSVGYMDPGNWATDLAGGSQFGYTLLSVILLSNLMAILLQHLSLKLGIVSERDLAQACRDHYSRPVSFGLWILCELAIAACDLAEIIGTGIALKLIFGIPLPVGVVITALDVMLILYLQNTKFRVLESLIAGLIFLIGACFAYELIVAQPHLPSILKGFIPSAEIVTNPNMLYIAIGILGATVMPHNLYLHSSIVQTRAYPRDEAGKREAIKYAGLDSSISLLFAFFINAAILILSAAAFHGTEHAGVAEIEDAYKLLSPVLKDHWASLLFGVALLASGLNSTITGTMAGQIVMEGFLQIRLKPWLRRLITRMMALVPALIVAIKYGDSGINKLLILSQVILSLQLSFAVFPLVQFTSERKKMGIFANSLLTKCVAWTVASVIAVLNGYLLVQIWG